MKEHQTTGSALDIRVLMQDIREGVLAQLEQAESTAASTIPGARKRSVNFQSPSEQKSTQAGELVHSEDLRWLNQHYTPGLQLDLSVLHSHRSGLIARCIKKIKSKILVTVWDYLLKGLIENIRDYRASQVRFMNRAARYVDERDGSLFWELIHKLDYDIGQLSERVERTSDESNGDLRQVHAEMLKQLHVIREQQSSLGDSLNALEGSYSKQLHDLQEVVRGMESILHRYSMSVTNSSVAIKETPPVVPAEHNIAGSTSIDLPKLPKLDYLLLENRFRGSESEISRRLEDYSGYLENLPGTILEIGPGRGEFLEICRQKGLQSFGIDLDQAMVDRCVEKGLKVEYGDGLEFLSRQDARSLGAIFAFQVIEHLNADQIESLITHVTRTLTPGGVVVFETINPLSLRALSSNYFRDPTHVAPLHPETMKYLLERMGLVRAEVVFRSPIPATEQLQCLTLQDYMTPKWSEFLRDYNGNIEKLNQLLFGCQDFSVAAYKPREGV